MWYVYIMYICNIYGWNVAWIVILVNKHMSVVASGKDSDLDSRGFSMMHTSYFS